tara:strand:+ start:3538 stop:3837 length:300 start_codon:yes stop_codon:yes gene_type:complete
MNKNGKYPSKGMNALASKRPDVAKKIMGYDKGGNVKVDEVIRMPKEIQIPGMMGGGMMNYKDGGYAKKMMGGGMMYKDGGDVEVVEQGGKGYKKTVKFK